MSDTITYEEALKRYEAGFIIESAETGRKFFKEWAKSSDKSVSQSQTFKPIEISGLWLREVGVKDSDSMDQFLVDYLTRNYETTPSQVETSARGIEHYLLEVLIPETLSDNKGKISNMLIVKPSKIPFRRTKGKLIAGATFCMCGRKVTGDQFYQNHGACFRCHMY